MKQKIKYCWVGLLFLIMTNVALGQKEGTIWYFGDYAGLDFRTGQPQPLFNGAMYTIEGCATISDKEGNLQFYTDGIEVYNRLHIRMPQGYGLLGDPSSTQSGVIIPVPDDTVRYLVFTVDNDLEDDGFCYSLVDMSLAKGLGDVDIHQKNINLMPVSTERITSVNHRNGVDIWVIVHEWGNRRFRAYLVTEDGVDPARYVVSDVGTPHNDRVNNGKGYMKASPGGEKIAVAIQGQNMVEVFDFNTQTGILSNPVTLSGVVSAYGIEFSEDARFLYAGERYGNNIHQWGIEAGSGAEIIDSHHIVGVLGTEGGGAMQLAPDGKIYIARKSKKYLSVIHNPSQPGAGCGFSDSGISLGDRAGKEGLPTFNQSFFAFYRFDFLHTCFGDTTFFFMNKTNLADSVLWDFGDPESDEANASEQFHPFHLFSAPGTFKVTLRVFQHGTYIDISEEVQIIPLPEPDLGDDLVVCGPDSIMLTPGYAFHSYVWNSSQELNDSYLYATATGLYTVEVANECGNASDTVFVEFLPLPEVQLGNDTVLQYDTYITLDAGNSFSVYRWQDGSGSSLFIVDLPGTYSVEVADESGCKGSDTILVMPVPFRIHVPTAFSPNRDGVNDLFRAIPSSAAPHEFRMMVFNRWGERVFDSNDISLGWDGTCNGVPCPVEVYLWVVETTVMPNDFYSEDSGRITGSVTLLR